MLLLLLYDMDVSCHRPFLPGTSLEPAVMPTAHYYYYYYYTYVGPVNHHLLYGCIMNLVYSGQFI